MPTDDQSVGWVSLTLGYPPSANRYWAVRGYYDKATKAWRTMTYTTAEAMTYKESVAWAAKAAGIRTPFAGRVELAYRLYPARPQDYVTRQRKEGATWDDTVRCIDLGNAEKVVSDALNGIAWEDDRWLRKIVAERMEPDEHGARLVVWIRPIPPASPQLPLA